MPVTRCGLWPFLFGDADRFGGDVGVDLGVALSEGLLPVLLLAMAFTAALGWALRAAGVDRVVLVSLDGNCAGADEGSDAEGWMLWAAEPCPLISRAATSI